MMKQHEGGLNNILLCFICVIVASEFLTWNTSEILNPA